MVLRCETGKPLKEKSSVFNKENKRIGIVSEIFGPVKTPYITVKPEKGVKPEELVGEKLYV